MSEPKPSRIPLKISKPAADGPRDQLRLGKAKRNLKGLKGHLNRHIEEAYAAYAAVESGVSAGDLHNRYDDITKVWNKIEARFESVQEAYEEVIDLDPDNEMTYTKELSELEEKVNDVCKAVTTAKKGLNRMTFQQKPTEPEQPPQFNRRTFSQPQGMERRRSEQTAFKETSQSVKNIVKAVDESGTFPSKIPRLGTKVKKIKGIRSYAKIVANELESVDIQYDDVEKAAVQGISFFDYLFSILTTYHHQCISQGVRKIKQMNEILKAVSDEYQSGPDVESFKTSTQADVKQDKNGKIVEI